MKVKVHHAPNTKDLKPNEFTDFSSWIDFWKSKKSLAMLKQGNGYVCPDCENITDEDDFHGAHVIKENGSKLYIVPTCSSCNEEKDTTSLFEVEEDWLVPMPEKKK